MDARLHGQADFRNGKLLHHNPYRSIKQGKRAWIKGWHEGREAEELFAQGTEAQRAETVKQGSVHDGPVRDSECAPKVTP